MADDATAMFHPTEGDAREAHAVADWALARLAGRRDVLPRRGFGAPLPSLGRTGIGTEAAVALFRDRLAPTAIPPDHPRYFSFVPGIPTVAAALADMELSVAMIYAGSYLEGGSVVEAEDAVIRWLADTAGYPSTAGGTFVSGGSIANLSALVAARGGGPEAHGRHIVVAGASAHSSMAAAAHIMGCELVTAPAAHAHGRLDARTLEQALAPLHTDEVVAVVATAGATNTGAFDDLAGVAGVCAAHDLRLHVDGAYGGAALLSPRTRPLMDGIERADSFIVDPHKMLYSTFDCAALVYRDRRGGLRRAHPDRRLPRRGLRHLYEAAEPLGPGDPPDAPRTRPAGLGVGPGLRHRLLRSRRGPPALTRPGTQPTASPARRCWRRRSSRRSP